MKKLFLALTIIVSACSFAQAADPNSKILAAFKADFTTATAVKWTVLEDQQLCQARFELDGETMNVFYNMEGEIVNTVRYIKKQQLPLMVTKAINNHFPKHIISTVIERNGIDGTTYFVTIAGEKKDYMIEAKATGAISIFKKYKKIVTH
jgi:hypothetical protein